MDLALDAARQAAKRGEVPVGAVVVKNGTVLATAGNRTIADHDPYAPSSRPADAEGSEKPIDAISPRHPVLCDRFLGPLTYINSTLVLKS